jgi:hypothetical protein
VNAFPASNCPGKGPYPLTRIRRLTIATFFLLSLLLPFTLLAADPAAKPTEPSAIGIADSMGDAMLQQATEVRDDLTEQARSLFEREPLGWDLGTLNAIYHWALDLPEHIPNLINLVIQHSRLLGVAGSLVILVFSVAVLYRLLGQRRVLRRSRRLRPPASKSPSRSGTRISAACCPAATGKRIMRLTIPAHFDLDYAE